MSKLRRVVSVGRAERHQQLVATVLAIGFLLTGCAEKPVFELQQAREALAMAQDFEADIYAPAEFEMAMFNLESGEFAIATQEQAPFWGRSYDLSLEYLALAVEQAEQARVVAEASKSDIFEQARNALPATQTAFQASYEAVESARRGPITVRDAQAFDEELAGIFATLNRSREIYDEGDYRAALVLFEEVRERAKVLESRAQIIADAAEPDR